MRGEIGQAFGAALFGVDAEIVEVQSASAMGNPRAAIIGSVDNEVREARERVRVALRGAGIGPKDEEPVLIINLAPAEVPKSGTGLDLPMCLSVAAMRQADLRPGLARLLAFAEVGLDGVLRPARGTLSAAMAARARGLAGIIVPPESAREAAEVEELEVLAVRTLADAVAAVRGRRDVLASWTAPPPPREKADVDLAEVKGQYGARRALEVAAAGGHNLLLIGPPGSGKTLLARRMPTILPPLTRDEALEVTRVHSSVGLVAPGAGLVEARPFRAPHHSVSAAGLAGGGSPPRPGEISLAAHGVLFLDELPEFPRNALETLRQPLEDGAITVVRARGAARFPARFILVGAMNPCPCGWRGAPGRNCGCSPPMVDRYRGRISGPLLDRIDLHFEVPAVTAADLARTAPGEGSHPVRERVTAARRVQLERNARFGVAWNAHLRGRDLAAACRLAPAGRKTLEDAMAHAHLSARAHDRILKVARTLADLGGREQVDAADVAAAVGYRCLDKSVGPPE